MRYLFAILLLLTLAGCGSAPSAGVAPGPTVHAPRARVEEVSVSLQPGWNPLAFQCSRVTALEGGTAVALAIFEGGQYRLAPPSLPEVNAGAGPRRGFYVYAPQAGRLTYQGEDDGQGGFADVVAGWNLLSTATDQPVTPVGTNLPLFHPAGGTLPPGEPIWAFANAPGRVRWASPSPSPAPSPSPLAVVRLELSPAELTLARYSNRQLSVLALLADGTRIDVTSQVAWTSSEPSAGAVSSTGLVTALFPLQVTITAALQGLSATSALTVTDLAPAPGIQPTPSPSPTPTPWLIVSSFSNNSARVFPVNASGDVAPAAVVEGAASNLGGPRSVQAVADRDELWVSGQTNSQVNVYRLSAVLANANPAPLRSFNAGGSNRAAYYDSAADRLFAISGNDIRIYDTASSLNGGTPAPTRAVTGYPPLPLALTVDTVGDRLFVAGNAGAAIFDNASTLDGTFAGLAKRTITGGQFSAVGYDRSRDRLYLGVVSGGGLRIFNNGSTVNNPAAPDATVTSSQTGSGSPGGLAYDPVADELYFPVTSVSRVLVFGGVSSLTGTVTATPVRVLIPGASGLDNPLGVDIIR